MSAKSTYKSKGIKIKTAPRTMEEITKEYNELRAKVADAQYNAFVYKLETDNLNQMMLKLNQEAAERKRLDAETASKAAANGASTEVQNVTA